jgi:flagellar motility protein MotE (MotC chaperone)
VTEGKIDQKMVELKALQDRVDGLLKDYDTKESLKIKSLIKIYENMKPKDAAKIFDQMDLKTLFDVVSQMKEAKAAAILASMDPMKAKEVSLEFVKKRDFVDQAKEN